MHEVDPTEPQNILLVLSFKVKMEKLLDFFSSCTFQKPRTIKIQQMLNKKFIKFYAGILIVHNVTMITIKI